MSKKKTVKVKEPEQVKKHYQRHRPGDGGKFYAPSADICNVMQPALSQIFKVMYPEEGKAYSAEHPSRKLANDLAYFIKSAYASGRTWDEDGMGQLNGVLDTLPPEDATTFLYIFFMSMMDYFWHGCRLETSDQTGDPEDMAKAMGMCQILRTMPKDMREEYLDHLKSHNLLPKVMYKGALLRSTMGDLK